MKVLFARDDLIHATSVEHKRLPSSNLEVLAQKAELRDPDVFVWQIASFSMMPFAEDKRPRSQECPKREV